MPIEMLFLDVGGPIYGDRPYYEALLAAIVEVVPDASPEEFWAEYDLLRREQRGPFTGRLLDRVAPRASSDDVLARARELWTYPPEALQPDAREAVPALASRYRLGVLANQQAWVRDVLARDGLAHHFEVWCISAELGVEKPDPAIFRAAIDAAGVSPERCAMVGDRLDNDVLPARRAGMMGVWMLRGEAPDEPSEEQLTQADAAVRTLHDIPDALAGR
jgi:HAD superfamily hydrolase (TIGR01549 family)